MIWPETKPDVDTDWEALGGFDVVYLEWVSFVAAQGAPPLFWLTQVFSLGESNFSDISLLYMDNYNASWYFVWNSLWTMSMYPVALLNFGLFWWVYLFELFIWFFLALFKGREEEEEEDD